MALCGTVIGLVFDPAAVFPLFRDQNRISIRSIWLDLGYQYHVQ